MAVKNVKIGSDVELKDRLVAINRVTKVTKGGRTFTFSAIVVVGDGNGIIGYGLGKAGEVTAAIAKGVESAKKNLVKVPVLKGVLESVGITDVLAKSKGSSNPHNLVKATFEALAEMRDAKTIAQNRGVSLDKVFRG